MVCIPCRCLGQRLLLHVRGQEVGREGRRELKALKPHFDEPPSQGVFIQVQITVSGDVRQIPHSEQSYPNPHLCTHA